MSRRTIRRLEAELVVERERVGELLNLLMAKASPADFYAQKDSPPAEKPPQWLFDETGLNSVPYYDEDEENDVRTR